MGAGKEGGALSDKKGMGLHCLDAEAGRVVGRHSTTTPPLGTHSTSLEGTPSHLIKPTKPTIPNQTH